MQNYCHYTTDTFHCEQHRLISSLSESDTRSWGKKINLQTRISCGEKQGRPATKSRLITISIKSAARDGTGFKKSMHLVRLMNIPKAWSRTKNKKDLEWRAKVDLGYRNCWPLDWTNQKVLFPTGGWANHSIQCWKPCVLRWDVTDLEVITNMQMKQRNNVLNVRKIIIKLMSSRYQI